MEAEERVNLIQQMSVAVWFTGVNKLTFGRKFGTIQNMTTTDTQHNGFCQDCGKWTHVRFWSDAGWFCIWCRR